MWDIVRWDPFREMASMRSQMDRFMAQLDARGGAAGVPWSPASDVIETDDEIVITAELPGVKDEDVEILVHDGLLTIRGERKLEEEITEDHFRRLERSYGGFERSFRLPEGVTDKDIKASVAYGVLRVAIPKPTPEKPRRVKVAKG